MPADLVGVLTIMQTTAMTFLQSVVWNYWPLILGLIILLGIGWKIRKVVGLAR